VTIGGGNTSRKTPDALHFAAESAALHESPEYDALGPCTRFNVGQLERHCVERGRASLFPSRLRP
jgi:hypothetical protein